MSDFVYQVREPHCLLLPSLHNYLVCHDDVLHNHYVISYSHLICL